MSRVPKPISVPSAVLMRLSLLPRFRPRPSSLKFLRSRNPIAPPSRPSPKRASALPVRDLEAMRDAGPELSNPPLPFRRSTVTLVNREMVGSPKPPAPAAEVPSRPPGPRPRVIHPLVIVGRPCASLFSLSGGVWRCLAAIVPTELGVPFETVCALVEDRRVGIPMAFEPACTPASILLLPIGADTCGSGPPLPDSCDGGKRNVS